MEVKYLEEDLSAGGKVDRRIEEERFYEVFNLLIFCRVGIEYGEEINWRGQLGFIYLVLRALLIYRLDNCVCDNGWVRLRSYIYLNRRI